MTLPRIPTSPVARPEATVQGDRYRITVLADGLLRLEHAPDGVFEDRASMLALHRDLPVPEFRVIERPDRLELVTDRLRLVYDRGPFSTSGLSVEVLGGVSAYDSVWRYGRQGAPSGTRGDGNLGGTARTLDEADGPVPLEPGVVSRNGYAVLDDSLSLLLDDDGWVAPRDGSRTDLYVFAYGHDHREALRAFYALSGRQPLLPRPALGTWWSRFHRYTEESYLALVRRFRAEGVPLAVAVIDMDWHVTDVDPRHGSGWTGYSWNRDLFPDPPRFLRALHDAGLQVTLNVHPADGVRSFEDAYPAMAAALGRDVAAGDPIAFDATDREFLAAYFDVLHRGLERDGVDFWWVDWQQGEHSRVPGVDPLWVLNHFHFLDNAHGGRRPLTFSRYAGPGSHRYPVGFSGDTVISWESLAFQPYFTATASNVGYGWWSHDVGGHMHGGKDDELAARWVQYGAFSPVLRLHSSADPFGTKEPWAFGPEARDVMVRYLRLRHRLVPYLHTMNHRAATDGRPLVEPLYHEWPDAPEAYDAPNQYLFGSELLVAPITTPADRATLLGDVRAWLPEGTWVDVLSGLVYDGGRELHLHRPLADIPVLARPGALVPLDGAEVPADGVPHPEHVEVLVVVGADGSFELVEDDGAASPALARTRVTFSQEAGTVVVHPVAGDAGVVPARRRWSLTFVALEAPAAEPVATVDGAAVAATARREADRLTVTVADVPAGASLQVAVGASPRLAANDVDARLFALLDRAQIAFETKGRVHRIATSPRPLAVRLSHLQALGLERALETAVSEILLARTPDDGPVREETLSALSQSVRQP